MRIVYKGFTLLFSMLILSCGGKEEKKKEGFSIDRQKTESTESKSAPEVDSNVKASEQIDLTNKGVGPVTSLTLDADVDEAMATAGAEIYKKMCTACHRIGKKFIGPAPNGILERRTPEWVMNMILNPEGMVSEDPLAKALLMEFNGAPMANQGLSEDDARSVLEYFRTL